MAELTTAETTADPCCAVEQQATCCEPSAKTECCDPTHGEGCGCAAGAADIRETHRVHAQAASAIVRARKPIEQPA